MTGAENLVYCVGDIKVNVLQRQVVTPEQTISVRPKTFSLLLIFLQNPTQVLTKEFLLNQVWDDVCVDEQVLVQSIRELRQHFTPLNVIQTYPRKGYAWAAPVTFEAVGSPSPLAQIYRSAPHKYLLFSVAAALLLLMVLNLNFFVFNRDKAAAPVAKNIITVLPVDNRTEGANLRWVRLGMMDQLIQSLHSSPHVQVLDVPYVLNLLALSQLDERQRPALIERIFALSGSSWVVDLELSGSVDDYRLLYRLYSRKSDFSGVLAERDLNSLIERLARIIASKTDAELHLARIDSAFTSSLLAEALEQFQSGQTATAVSLLRSAIALEPNNFLAHQFLIEYELQQGNSLQAATAARHIIAQSEVQSFERSYIFYYLLGSAELAQGNLEAARSALAIAQPLAEQKFDSLYQAYIASLWGDRALLTGDAPVAEEFYLRALALHESIACPIGMGLAHVKLIEVLASQQQIDSARDHWNQLNRLVAAHQLPIALPVLAGD